MAIMYVNQSGRVGGKEKVEMNDEEDKSREVELEMKQRNENRGRENVILYGLHLLFLQQIIILLVSRKYINYA